MRLSADDKRILQELPEDSRISDEYKRLRELYADITGNRLKLVLKLISQAAFMSVTLADLADYISKNGCTEEYQNGENQWGKKKSSEVDVYNTMVKNYASVIKQLTEALALGVDMKYGEKLTFIDDDGRTAVFHAGTASPFWWNDADGLDGLTANIYTVKGAGQDGETDVAANLAMRSITIEGQIRGQAQAQYRRALLNAMRPAATGKLVYEYKGETRYIRCRVKQAPEFSNTRVEKFQVVFSCANPFWRKGSGGKQVTNIAFWVPALSFPAEIPEEGMALEYRSPSLIVNINNSGDVPVGMLIEFRATGTTANPYLINVGTQERLLINRAMEPGDIIRVWTGYGEKRLELTRAGLTSNIFNDLDVDSAFLQLAVGDNLLRYGADVTDNLEASIYYDVAYVGV